MDTLSLLSVDMYAAMMPEDPDDFHSPLIVNPGLRVLVSAWFWEGEEFAMKTFVSTSLIASPDVDIGAWLWERARRWIVREAA